MRRFPPLAGPAFPRPSPDFLRCRHVLDFPMHPIAPDLTPGRRKTEMAKDPESIAGGADAGSLLLRNGVVLDYFPVALDAAARPQVERCDLRIGGERIIERGRGLTPKPGETVVDLQGVTVMPGNVNAHGHLYAALAAGMPLPKVPLETFTDILTEIWWPLDRALDAEAIYLSSLAGSWDAVRCGTTLIFDHHASLASVGGSLDRVETGLAKSGCGAASATRSPTAGARVSAT